MDASSPEVTCPVCGALTELVTVFKSKIKTKYFKSPTEESQSYAQLYWRPCLNGSLVGQLGRKFHTALVTEGVGARIYEPCMLLSPHLLDEYQLDFLDSSVGGQRQRRKQTGEKKNLYFCDKATCSCLLWVVASLCVLHLFSFTNSQCFTHLQFSNHELF